jgi:hypothetical protein
MLSFDPPDSLGRQMTLHHTGFPVEKFVSPPTSSRTFFPHLQRVWHRLSVCSLLITLRVPFVRVGAISWDIVFRG